MRTLSHTNRDYYFIGFAGQFYTLWQHNTDGNGAENRFIQNLSTDEEKAVKRALAMLPQYDDIEVTDHCGDTWSSKGLPDYKQVIPHLCTIGVFTGLDIRTLGTPEASHHEVSYQIWALKKEYENSAQACQIPDLKRRALARRRLIELGELVRYTYTDRDGVSHKYCPVNLRDAIELNKQLAEETTSGHWFQERERHQLTLTMIREFSFEGYFGRCYIHTFKDEDGRLFTYKGGSPFATKGEKITVKATIAHDEYKGEPQTLLKRPAVI